MTIIKNRIIYSLMIISTVILIDFMYFASAAPANNAGIIIDENLRPGMALKNAIELLGPPERIKVSNIGTVVIPYDTLGLSIEVMSDGTTIEAIHLQSSFRGHFASGLEIGVDYQKILSVYNQPDIMTRDIIEYSDLGWIFQIKEGRLAGADLYSGKSTLYRQVSSIETGRHEDKEIRRHEDKETGRYEDKETGKHEEVSVFDLFGFKVRNTNEGVVITEIRPGSVAEHAGLIVGERVRKAYLEGYGARNIYYLSGLEDILKKAIEKGKKTVNILQKKNHYYMVEVPKRK